MRKPYTLFVLLLLLILSGGIGFYYYNSTKPTNDSDTSINTTLITSETTKKSIGASCTNNSECVTNSCSNNKCILNNIYDNSTYDVSVSDTTTTATNTACVEIKRYGSSTVSKGNVVVYKFVYSSASSTNPLSKVGLLVSGGIGRDFYRKNSATVKPSVQDNNPKYDASRKTWTYYFTWEAENPTDNIIKNIESSNALSGVIYTDVNNPATAINPIDCLAASDTSVANDLNIDLVLNKFVNEVCSTDGTAQYIFDIRVTNIGQQQSTISGLESLYDVQNLLSSPLVSTITKNGTNTGKTVSWTSAGTIGVGETQKFSYILNINPSDLARVKTGLSTVSSLTYGSNSAEFEKIITPICTGKISSQIPVTGILDNTVNLLFIGLFLLLAGLFSVKYVNIHPRVLALANRIGINSEFTNFEEKILKHHESREQD